MEVILKEDVSKLGARGDVVKVAEGYGRNYLLPKKLAIEATSQNKSVIQQMKVAALRRAAKEKSGAEELAKLLEGVSVGFVRRAGEHDQLFGSVTTSEIAAAIEKKGFEIDRRKIVLEHPIKTTGEFTVQIHLHKEVRANIKVLVEKEVEAEAEAAPSAAEPAEA
jgi:large subunit ribosomal protein L9